ncbi:CLUMA_CG020835, isoform A [Clunio marinus]|uniref:CLUMA_CG020835, isoform A n=1 Tax=Clunio marinus TaxID=568069 RepID=A0A1J1J7M5_9DIPT|nr:CLUMA_CG020835, isoform A [Clunio marinus]
MMRNLNVIVILILGISLPFTKASYAGPFLFWGMENLDELKVPTLQAIDDKVLRDVYSGASSIVVFIRNATNKLNYENFPKLSELIGKNEWLYLPQSSLSSDPLEYNVNAEVFVLTGPPEQQDVEVAALYRDAQINYGQKNILGILATRSDKIDHTIYKREAKQDDVTTEMPTTTSSDDSTEDNLIYSATGKGILYTTEIPILKIKGSKPSEDVTYSLQKHAIVTADDRQDIFKLIIKFIVPEKTITIRFCFQISGGKWIMNQAEVDIDGKTTMLNIVGETPKAPLGFSFACGNSFVFKSAKISLLLKNIQVQPLLKGENKFSKAFDCVGIVSPAIVSGIFVTFILGIVLSIAITAILDIKTPNKFENRSSKQLTFTVQE